MKTVLDLTSNRYGRLTVTAQSGKVGRRIAWLCHCDCGQTVVVSGNNLSSGNTRSCGCRRREVTRARSVTHGKSKTGTWRIWQAMLERCNRKKSIQYSDYGGRGISVCSRWKKYENFLADMGERPKGTSLERVDNSKGYSPKNCKWASRVEQANNKRNNKLITHMSKTLTVAQWALETGIPYHTLYQRVFRYGWPPIQALTK